MNKPDYFKPDHFSVGQKVRYGEFPGVVHEHYNEGMWNVRLPGGVACVSGSHLQCTYGAENKTAPELLESIDEQVRARAYVEPDDAEYFKASSWIKDEAIIRRILIERAIVREVVTSIAGKVDADGNPYTISVFDGEAAPIKHSRDAAAIMVEVGACDEEALIIQRAPHDGSGERPRVGSISLVYGNDGWDVMADNTATDEMASLMAGADRLSDELGDLLSQELIASRQHSLG